MISKVLKLGIGRAAWFAAAVWLVSATLATVMLGAPPSAHADQPPVVLTAVSAVDVNGDTKLTLTFAPVVPGYQVIKNDTDTPSLAFGLTTRGGGAFMPNNLHGVLKGIDVQQADTVLILHFTTQGLAHLTVTKDGNVLTLLIARPTRAEAAAAAGQAPVGPLPHALDRDPAMDDFEVVPLKYADVSEIVGLLTSGLTVKPNDSFTPQEPAFGSAGMGGSYAQPQPQQVQPGDQPMAQSVDDTIGIDRRLNAIILHGSAERIARLKAKIAKLDVPVTSVVLETTFVELTESGARNLGIDFNNANNQIAVAQFQSGSFASANFGKASGTFSSSLQSAIYAQVQKGEGRIISRPRISAQSGGTAKIITGDALPILTSIALSGVNAVSQQVQYVNVGVTLQIAPRISEDGYVTSHVFCEVSSVTGTSQGYPTISQREASTSATVKDGEAFIIGGLTEENEITNNSKLPVAGDVPLLGSVFNVKKSTRSKTQLYIVVTPHIVRGGDGPAAEAALKSAD